MEIDRKGFLKLVGGGLLGLAVVSFIDKLPKVEEKPKTAQAITKKEPIAEEVIEFNPEEQWIEMPYLDGTISNVKLTWAETANNDTSTIYYYYGTYYLNGDR